MKTTLLFIATIFTMGAYAQTVLIDEGFEDITTLDAAGYVILNACDSPTELDWFQGVIEAFTAFDGEAAEYIAVNFQSTSGGLLHVFVLLPTLDLSNSDQVSFYTKTTCLSLQME